MKFNYENLDVYKLSCDYVAFIYKLTKKFPKEESFGLSSQIRRSSTSIVLNIVEGTSRASKKDFALFIERAIGSLIETRAVLDISKDLNYINDGDRLIAEEMISELFFKLNKLKKVLRSNPK